MKSLLYNTHRHSLLCYKKMISILKRLSMHYGRYHTFGKYAAALYLLSTDYNIPYEDGTLKRVHLL